MNDLMTAHEEKIGTQRELLAPIKRREATKQAIWAEQYAPPKERELVLAAEEVCDQEETAAEAGLISQEDVTRDKELAMIDAEEKRANTIAAQGTAETDAVYAARLARHQIAETQAARRATLASMDVVTIGMSNDAAQIAAVLDRTFTTGDDDVIGRVVLAGEGRLVTLAVEEGRQVPAGGSRPVANTLATVRAQIQTWRAAQTAKSAVARRAKVVAEHATRVAAIRRSAADVRRGFRIGTLDRAIRIAAATAAVK